MNSPQCGAAWSLRSLMPVGVLILLALGRFTPCVASDRPNIVFFLIDDLGWTDVGYMYGQLARNQRYYETPHIDELAEDATVFTQAYANAPNCAPSRACLMSGQYSPRHGIYTVGDPRRGNHRFRRLEPIENKTVLDDHVVTLAESLRRAGYATASIGKWHLGADPMTQGFDVNVGGKHWGSPSGGGYHSPLRYPNLEVEQSGHYLTDVLTDKAIEFIHANRRRPFFLYLTHYAVHTPIQAKEELTAKYRAKRTTRHHGNAKYAAMIASVDDSVGAVLGALSQLKLADTTIVVFYSDNGGHGGATSNNPLRGAKGMLYEGGIRVPLIIRWPGVTKPNSVCSEPVIGVDLYPTLLEMTGVRYAGNDELDGVSLVRSLRDPESSLPRNAIYWRFPAFLQGSGDPAGGPFRTTPAGAIRMGDWKLIEWFETGRLELYNVVSDPSETNNRAAAEPAKREDLLAAMRAWRERVDAPIPNQPNPRFDPTAEVTKKIRN